MSTVVEDKIAAACDLLKRVTDYLQDEKHWIRGYSLKHSAKHVSLGSVGVQDLRWEAKSQDLSLSDEPQMCILGALFFIGKDDPVAARTEAFNRIKEATGLASRGAIIRWNDTPATDHADVMGVLAKAQEGCE